MRACGNANFCHPASKLLLNFGRACFRPPMTTASRAYRVGSCVAMKQKPLIRGKTNVLDDEVELGLLVAWISMSLRRARPCRAARSSGLGAALRRACDRRPERLVTHKRGGVADKRSFGTARREVGVGRMESLAAVPLAARPRGESAIVTPEKSLTPWASVQGRPTETGPHGSRPK